MLKVENLDFAYRSGEKVLRDVSIDFPQGHIFVVLGLSGSGKTTLLRLLGRFLKPTAGRILLHDQELQKMAEKDLRQKLGFVFQQLYLFPHYTVMENMTLAPVHVLNQNEEASRKKALDMLDHLAVADFADQYPAQISGGQAQRVAIARALMLSPEYLLLDEPTSALDVNTTEDFGKLLLDLQQETTFVVVTHDITFASQVASHGVLMSEGQVTSHGDMEDLLRAFQGETVTS